MDESLEELRQAQRRRSLSIVSVIASVMVLGYGLFLLSQGHYPGTAVMLLVAAVLYGLLAKVVISQPERYQQWLWAEVALGLLIKTIGAWTRDPVHSNAFFYDSGLIIAVGYAISARATIFLTAVSLVFQWISYWVAVAVGRVTVAEVMAVAPDTALAAVLTCILVVVFRRRYDTIQAEVEEHYRRLKEVRARDVAQYEALREAHTKMEGLATELERSNQALKEASDVRGRFLANMSHEIRTPMNAVVGVSDLLMETELSEKQEELASLIQQSGHALLRVLNDILDVSKLQAGRMEVRPAPTELRAELAGAVRMFEGAAEEAGLALSLNVKAGLPPWIRIDAGRLNQIVLNYVSNAIKFTAEGSVRVHAQCNEDHTRLRVEVTDTGAGVAPDQLDRLFLPFEQLDASTTRTTRGTGLGLAICKQLAELMGGAVGVDSELGRGSTFWVELPAIACAPPARSKPPTTEVEGLKHLKVLVADDNPVNQRVALGFLRRLGLGASVAGDGQEVLELLEAEGGVDVILMDCQMPRMDGYAATAKIREDPRFSGIRVVALTASALEEDVERSRAAGMDAHLSKPYSLDQLRDALLAQATTRARDD